MAPQAVPKQSREQMTQAYGTTVAIGKRAVLLRGPSGSGKSDLALRMIDAGALLVADDRTELCLDNGQIWATAPNTIAGKLEVRGLGIVDVPYFERVALKLVADLVPRDQIERMPERAATTLLDQELPLIRLCAFEVSATAKLRLALTHEAAP